MKKFEDVKQSVILHIEDVINEQNQELAKKDLPDLERRISEGILQDCQGLLENIDECTVIEIGNRTNKLIKGLQTAYKDHQNDYFKRFEYFLDEYVVGLDSDGNAKYGRHTATEECYCLGIGVDDLLLFKGKDPFDSEVCDQFKKLINANFGTNIPMADVEEQVRKEFKETIGTEEHDKAFVHLREVERDSGELMHWGLYYPLALDDEYQEAKSRCSGMKL